MTLPTAGDFIFWEQRLEGARIADWQWGTAAAKQIIVTGTFTNDWVGTTNARCVWLSIRNAALNRSYVVEIYKIASGTPAATVNFVAVIPGDTAGVWPTTNALGALLNISLGAGVTYETPANTWTAANKLTTNASAVHTLGQTGIAHLKITNVGLYLDPYKTGVAPSFEMPDYARELRRCQRYWYRAYGFQAIVSNGTVAPRGGMRHPVPMRATPTGTVRGAVKLYNGAVTPTVTTLATVCNQFAAEFDITTGGTFAAGGWAAAQYWQSDDIYIEMNARM